MDEELMDTRCENCYKYLIDLCPGAYPAMDELGCWQSVEDVDEIE